MVFCVVLADKVEVLGWVKIRRSFLWAGYITWWHDQFHIVVLEVGAWERFSGDDLSIYHSKVSRVALVLSVRR